MTGYVSRSGWTSSSASGDTLTGSGLRGVAVHWPGTSQDRIGSRKSAIRSRLRGYRDHHIDGNGWRDIGYNLAIDQAGRVWMCRSTAWHGNMVGAHCASSTNPDANEEYVGVLLLLGDREQPSRAMVAAFQDWYHNRFLAHWSGRTDVRGHGHVSGAQASCPGPYVRAVLDDLTGKPGKQPPKKPRVPLVDLSKLREAARADPPRGSWLARYPTGTKHVERALVAEGLLSRSWRDRRGHFGSKTVTAYAAWQRRCGYSGRDADGIPGRDSLTRLGKRHSFGVTP